MTIKQWWPLNIQIIFHIFQICGLDIRKKSFLRELLSKLSHLGGIKNFARKGVKRGGWCRNGGEGCHFFITLMFNCIYCVWQGKKSFLYYILILQSFELIMQDSHPNLFIIKIFYHLHISDSFWCLQRMLTALFKLVWNK